MSRIRRNVFLEPEHAKAIDKLAVMSRRSKSQVIAAALSDYLSLDSESRRDADFARRLEKLTQEFERIERDQLILLETFALFLRHHFAVTPPIPEVHQEAARAQGKLRYQQFIDQLARQLQSGQSLVREVFKEIAPREDPALNGSEGVSHHA